MQAGIPETLIVVDILPRLEAVSFAVMYQYNITRLEQLVRCAMLYRLGSLDLRKDLIQS